MSGSAVVADATRHGSSSARTSARGASGTRQRGDIQGMRAVAVLLVVASHAGVGFLAGGYVGVDVFFVLSGFLITGILLREADRDSRISILTFYARRARRILPAATVCLVVVAIASALVLTAGRLAQALGDVSWAAFFAANIHFALQGTDYFDASSYVSPVRHFWSLAVEEQFYLVWPPLIALTLFFRRRRRERTNRGRRVLDRGNRSVLVPAGIIVAVLFLASLAWSHHDTLHHANPAYYSTFTRGYELAAGALLAVLTTTVARWHPAVKTLLGWVGLVMIVLAALLYTEKTSFPGLHALLPVLGAVLVVAAGVPAPDGRDVPTGGARVLLDTPPMRFFGDISYSLYLWHWPILVLPVAYVGHALPWWQTLGLVVAAVLVSTASYRFVENPIRRGAWFSRRRLRALVLWPLALVLTLGTAGVTYAAGVSRAGAATAYVKPDVDPEPDNVQDSSDPIKNDVDFAAELARANYPLPKTLRPGLDRLADDISRPANGCFANGNRSSHSICSAGDVHSTHVMVLYGDSHAGMWQDVMSDIAKQQGYRLVTFMEVGCPPIEANVWRDTDNKIYTYCTNYRSWALGQIAKLKPEQIVTTGQLTVHLAGTDGRELSVHSDRATFERGAQETFTKLKAITPHVHVLSDPQKLAMDAATCLGSRRATMGTCSRPLLSWEASRDTDFRRAAQLAGVSYVDLTPYFWDDKTCPVVVDDMIVYRDSHHVTTTYARFLEPELVRGLSIPKAG